MIAEHYRKRIVVVNKRFLTPFLPLGDAGSDTLRGGAGRDVCLGGDGADDIDGGLERDTVSGVLGIDVISTPSEIDNAFTFDFNKLLV